MLCPGARHISPSLVLVQPRKTCTYITERLLIGCKESNQTKTLCLGFIGMDHVISELCYRGTILQGNYRKMTILWSFSYNSFVKFHGKIILGATT